MAAAVGMRIDHPPHLEDLRAAAASQRNLQAVERSAVCRRSAGHRRALLDPDRAVVLCVDEKSQIQALDRTQPCCRCARAGRAANHDYKRHGTLSLFAALDVRSAKSSAAASAAPGRNPRVPRHHRGNVPTARCSSRPRQRRNHKTKLIRNWLASGRWHVHFTLPRHHR